MEAKNIVFITDTHIALSSNVRNGDYLQDIAEKLQFVVEYCNQNNADLLIGGDIFDKPSVPDQVKSKVISVFKKLKTKCYTIPGNHSMLYGNEEFNYKTSYNVLCESGLFEDISGTELDLGPCYISSKLPVITKDKPQIVIYHGFLNSTDKLNVNFSDITATSPTYLCLGHDHVDYEVMPYTENVRIFRPGSLVRGTRSDTHLRTPKLLHIRVTDKLQFKYVDIACRNFNEIFKSKDYAVSSTQVHRTYDDVIAQIRSYQNEDMTLEQAISQVASPEINLYCLKAIEDIKNEKFK